MSEGEAAREIRRHRMELEAKRHQAKLISEAARVTIRPGCVIYTKKRPSSTSGPASMAYESPSWARYKDCDYCGSRRNEADPCGSCGAP